MNEQLFLFFYNFAHQWPVLDSVIIFTAEYLGFFPFMGIIFYFLYENKEFNWRKASYIFFIMLGTGAVAWIIAHLVKDVFQTLRPFVALPSVEPLFLYDGYAFPSGHTTFFMAITTVLLFYHKAVGVFLAFFTIIIGIARIMSGVHWPIDIIGGLLLGLVIGVGMQKIFKIINYKL